MSFVVIEVPPEVTPESSALQLIATFTSRHPTQDIQPKTYTPRFPQRHSPKDIGLEHIGPFLAAIMQLKPANTGILLGDNGDDDSSIISSKAGTPNALAETMTKG